MPVAFTLKVAVWPAATVWLAGCDVIEGGTTAGFTVSTAVRVAPPYDAEIVTEVDATTALVATVNVALVAPAGTVTLDGT